MPRKGYNALTLSDSTIAEIDGCISDVLRSRSAVISAALEKLRGEKQCETQLSLEQSL